MAGMSGVTIKHLQPPRFDHNQNREIREYFDENGFAIIKNGISNDALEDFRNELKATINAFSLKAGLTEQEGDTVFNEGLLALENFDHEHVAAAYDAVFQTPSFMRIVSDKRLEKAVKNVMGVEGRHPLYGFTNRCLFALPEDKKRTYDWHQEVFYTIPPKAASFRPGLH